MKHIIIISLVLIVACNSTSQETKIVEELYNYDVEERIKELGIELTEPGAPVKSERYPMACTVVQSPLLKSTSPPPPTTVTEPKIEINPSL